MFPTFEKWVRELSIPGKFAVTNVAVTLFPDQGYKRCEAERIIFWGRKTAHSLPLFRLVRFSAKGRREPQVNTLIYSMGEEADDVVVSFTLTNEQAKQYKTVKD